jgi:hypothetical protein
MVNARAIGNVMRRSTRAAEVVERFAIDERASVCEHGAHYIPCAVRASMPPWICRPPTM